MSTGPRILVLDIERAPNIVHKWRLFDKHSTPLSQVEQFGRTICFAASWEDKSKVEFYSEFHHGTEEMVSQARRLLDEADITVGYNQVAFDLPHLRTEIEVAGLPVESPTLDVDLLRVVRKHFRFESNKLDNVAQQLGVGSKVKHEGHALWMACMAGDERAWARMRRYNIGDVRLTKGVYRRLLPRIHNHPHMGLYTDREHCCNRCASVDLERRGYAYTALSTFQQYRCNDCGGWSRGKTAIARVDERGIA